MKNYWTSKNINVELVQKLTESVIMKADSQHFICWKEGNEIHVGQITNEWSEYTQDKIDAVKKRVEQMFKPVEERWQPLNDDECGWVPIRPKKDYVSDYSKFCESLKGKEFVI